MGRYVKDGDGRPGGGNGKNKEEWGKGATDGSELGDHLQGLHDNPDTIDGLGGDDNINGFSGDDNLTGGDGADDITTGQGADIVDLGVIDDNGTPELLDDDTYVGDGDNDTVNIGVDDDVPVIVDTLKVDLYDTILGYEVAEEGVDAEEGTFTTHDAIDLGGMGGSLDAFVDANATTGGTEAVGDVVDQVTSTDLQGVLWVTAAGELVFDADGDDDADPADDDILAILTSPDGTPAADDVTVRFQAEIEVVEAVDGTTGFVTSTTTEMVEHVAVWDDGAWSISIDGGDWMVV